MRRYQYLVKLYFQTRMYARTRVSCGRNIEIVKEFIDDKKSENKLSQRELVKIRDILQKEDVIEGELKMRKNNNKEE